MTQPSDAMIERVARAPAICADDEPDQKVSNGQAMWEFYSDEARAAIAATGLVEEVERLQGLLEMSEAVLQNYAKAAAERDQTLAENPDVGNDWGCEWCRNDGKLTALGTCPKCDAEYPDATD